MSSFILGGRAKNLLKVRPKLTEHEVDLITNALAELGPKYRPRERVKQNIGLACRKDVMTSLRIYGQAGQALARKLEEWFAELENLSDAPEGDCT